MRRRINATHFMMRHQVLALLRAAGWRASIAANWADTETVATLMAEGLTTPEAVAAEIQGRLAVAYKED